MSTIKISEDFGQPVTEEEAAENVTWFERWCKQVDEDNEKEPLPNDILDYMEGKKWGIPKAA